MSAYHIVFDGFPSPDGPRFIEVENDEGKSINAGTWAKRPDGLCALVLPIAALSQSNPSPLPVDERHERALNAAVEAVALNSFDTDDAEAAIRAYLEAMGTAVTVAQEPNVEAGTKTATSSRVWWPIKEAPRDGRDLLITSPTWFGDFIVGGFHFGAWRQDPDPQSQILHPTHFMHVPELNIEFVKAREAEELTDIYAATQPAAQEPIQLTYTNWRGETSERKIIPIGVWFGSTDWHPEPQWLLKAHDCEKGAQRDFALKDFGRLPAAQEQVAVKAIENMRGYEESESGTMYPSDDGDGWILKTATIDAIRSALSPPREPAPQVVEQPSKFRSPMASAMHKQVDHELRHLREAIENPDKKDWSL